MRIGEWLAQPGYTRRMLLILVTAVSIFILLWSNIKEVPVQGESLIGLLFSVSTGAYATGKVLDKRNGNGS